MNNEITNQVKSWVKRMTNLHGRFVVSREGKKYRWKEALCRERYGEHWKTYLKVHHMNTVDERALQISIQWEEGKTPSWVLGYT